MSAPGTKRTFAVILKQAEVCHIVAYCLTGGGSLQTM
jgi:hypothetical protein